MIEINVTAKRKQFSCQPADTKAKLMCVCRKRAAVCNRGGSR